MDKIARIRQEIERQMKFYDEKEREVLDDPKQFTHALFYQGHQRMCAKLLFFLDTLSEEPDKSLEDAIMEYYGNMPDDKDKVDAAHHFAQWGAEHLHDTTKMIDKSLEEAAEEKYPVYWKSYPKDGIVRSDSSYDTNKQCRDAFIAGAEWQKEQDMEEWIKDRDVCFWDGVNEGKKAMYEQMKEEQQ